MGSISSDKQERYSYGLYKMEAFYRKEGQTEKSLARKNESLLRESKSSDDDGFSLAELLHFHWLGLLLDTKKILLPPLGAIRKLHFLLGSVKSLSSVIVCKGIN